MQSIGVKVLLAVGAAIAIGIAVYFSISRLPRPAVAPETQPPPQEASSARQVSSTEVSSTPIGQNTSSAVFEQLPLEEVSFFYATSSSSYTIGDVKIEIYCEVHPNENEVSIIPCQSVQEEQKSNVFRSFFKVFQGGKEVFSSSGVEGPDAEYGAHPLAGVSKFSYAGDTFLLVTDWTGGNKCCGTLYIFKIDRGGIVVPLEGLGDALAIQAGEYQEALLKDGRVYLALHSGFSYYYAGADTRGFFVENYYQIQGHELVQRNGDFASEYRKKIDSAQHELDTLYRSTMPGKESIEVLDWFLPLTEKIMNYRLSGQGGEKVLQEVDRTISSFLPYTAKESLKKLFEEVGPLLSNFPSKALPAEILKFILRPYIGS